MFLLEKPIEYYDTWDCVYYNSCVRDIWGCNKDCDKYMTYEQREKLLESKNKNKKDGVKNEKKSKVGRPKSK